MFFFIYIKIRIISWAMSILRNIVSGYTVEYATAGSSLGAMELA